MAKVQPKDMQRRRARRAASLTAEALWNIQMEDDIMVNTNAYHEKNSVNKITLRHSAKSAGKRAVPEFDKAIIDAPREKKAKLKYNSETGNPDCMHFPSDPSSKNTSKIYRSKGKWTASVAPLVKTEMKSADSSHVSMHNDVSRRVVYLPISLNPNVPLLAIHTSPMNVDLRCLDPTQIVSPLVGVAPLLTGSSGSHVPLLSGDSSIRNTRYNASAHTDVHILKKINSDSTGQTEPLNLKLGESSIPSGSGINSVKSTLFSRISSRKSVCYDHYPFDTGKRMLQKSYRPPAPTKETVDSTLPLQKYQKGHAKPGKNGGTTCCRDFIGYDSHSPSSESSCSTDFEESTVLLKKRKRSQKNQINLRCKAAPPRGQNQGKNYDRVENSQNILKTRRLSWNESVTDSNNGWEWEGKSYDAYVYSVETAKPVLRRCYAAMRRKTSESRKRDSAASFDTEDDDDEVVTVRDCVMMRADGDEQPYVAKIASLWQHPKSGTMMISLLWFYRPEHTEDVRVLDQLDRYNENELFASRHLDEISVACVEDKCYVLTYLQYCRFIASSEGRDSHIGSSDGRDLIPPFPTAVKPHQTISPGTDKSLVFFCRKIYDIKLHRLLKTFSPPTALFSINSSLGAKQTSTAQTLVST